MQVRLASLRAEMKRQEAQEELARKKQQEAQYSTLWAKLLKQVQPEKVAEQSPQEVALLAAKARERKFQDILGPPPVPPLSPKGKMYTCCLHLKWEKHGLTLKKCS